MNHTGIFINKDLKKTLLHPDFLSPDPTVIDSRSGNAEGVTRMTLFPHQLLKGYPYQESLIKAAQNLDAFSYKGEIVVEAGEDGRIDLLLDFGAELDGALEIDITTTSPVNVMAAFGESAYEAEGLVFSAYPVPVVHWYAGLTGNNAHTYDARGFRYVRLVFNDVRDKLTINRISAECDFSFDGYKADFVCSDKVFQRLWYTSAYTARLCTRPDSFWDGIKRDRIGWFGDARITKETADIIFLNPVPAEAMMETLPVDKWANGVPNYSFDAIAILVQHMMAYGTARKCIDSLYASVKKFLDWVDTTQVNSQGFIIRNDLDFFYDIGFLDWSRMPVGGRFEELSWLQCKYVEGLRNAARAARMLGLPQDAKKWEIRAEHIEKNIIKYFWDDKKGFIHTLNHIGQVNNPHLPGYDGHYIKTYVEKIQKGPSNPTRQANALAVLAGICSDTMKQLILSEIFDNSRITKIITPYFSFFEQSARGLCGDGKGAVAHMRDYVGGIIQREDMSTVWEMYDEDVQDIRKYASHFDTNWICPLSMCHGWGSGAVPIAFKYLLGINITAPGYQSVAIDPAKGLGWDFCAAIPTLTGEISISCEDGKYTYIIPKNIQVAVSDTNDIEIRRK